MITPVTIRYTWTTRDGQTKTYELPAVHYPIHNTDSEECWCGPVVEVMENGTKVIIHNEEC